MEFDRILTGAVAQIRIGGVIRRKLPQAVVFCCGTPVRRWSLSAWKSQPLPWLAPLCACHTENTWCSVVA